MDDGKKKSPVNRLNPSPETNRCASTKVIPSQLSEKDLQVQVVDLKEAFGGPRPAPRTLPAKNQAENNPETMINQTRSLFGRMVSRIGRSRKNQPGKGRRGRQRGEEDSESSIGTGKRLRIESLRPKVMKTATKGPGKHVDSEEQSIFVPLAHQEEGSTMNKVTTMMKQLVVKAIRPFSVGKRPPPAEGGGAGMALPTTMEPVPGSSANVMRPVQLRRVVMKNGIPKSLHDAIEAFLANC